MTLPDYIARLIIAGTEKKFSEMHEDWLEETYGEKVDKEEE